MAEWTSLEQLVSQKTTKTLTYQQAVKLPPIVSAPSTTTRPGTPPLKTKLTVVANKCHFNTKPRPFTAGHLHSSSQSISNLDLSTVSSAKDYISNLSSRSICNRYSIDPHIPVTSHNIDGLNSRCYIPHHQSPNKTAISSRRCVSACSNKHLPPIVNSSNPYQMIAAPQSKFNKFEECTVIKETLFSRVTYKVKRYHHSSGSITQVQITPTIINLTVPVADDHYNKETKSSKNWQNKKTEKQKRRRRKRTPIVSQSPLLPSIPETKTVNHVSYF